ncbi:MAG: ribonuclease Z [Flammeovirgaceae bacterium]|nr:ribonuclease Z [Flammeovirgaceae bacterium]
MSFNITILGSAGAMPSFGRFPSSQFIEIQNRYFLIDCGEGAQMQMMRYGVSFHRVDHIFISHLHGDHYLGLMGFLFTLHLQRRQTDLHIYSHPGLDEIITLQLRHSLSSLNYKILFHRLEEGESRIIFEDNVLTVETIPLVHKIRCSGFLFKEKPKPRRVDKTHLPEGLTFHQIASLKDGKDVTDEQGNIIYKNSDLTLPPRHSRSYAYCSDTKYHETLVPRIKDMDILYHEATFMTEELDKAIDTKHSTAEQAAIIALKSQVKKLLIGHFSARYKELDGLLKEAKAIFPNTVLAIEGETFSLEE